MPYRLGFDQVKHTRNCQDYKPEQYSRIQLWSLTKSRHESHFQLKAFTCPNSLPTDHPNNISDQHYLSLLYTKLLSIGRFYEQKESFKDNGGNNSFGIEVGQSENVLDI